MPQPRTIGQLLLPLCFVFILNSCAAYHHVDTTLDQGMASEPEAISVRWQEGYYELQRPLVEEEVLKGRLAPVLKKTYWEIEDDEWEFQGKAGEKRQAAQRNPSLQEMLVQVNPEFTLLEVGLDSLPKEVAIPLEMIDQVQIRELDSGKTVLRTLGGMVLVSGVALVIIAATKDSCPFIYVKDDLGHWQLVGEIYSGAIHPPLERDDYMVLPHSGSGPCEVKITNEVLEIQHTNLARLLIFDHSPDKRVMVDRLGQAYLIDEPVPPLAAKSLGGVDVLDRVARNDGLFFLDGTGDRWDPERPWDGMTLTFPRPQDAEEMRVVIKARNSPWLDHTMGILFERMGDLYQPWQKAMKTGDAEGMRNWSRKQGLFLVAWLETESGWQELDYFDLPGPIAPREAVLGIDLDRVQGDQIRIKLECGYRFWEIDSVQADFGDSSRPEPRIVDLATAVNAEGQDVAEELRAVDALYLHQPDLMDEALLTFDLPSLEKGKARSVILHSRGHYDLLRQPRGVPEGSFAASFFEPGRVSRFSWDFYQELYGKTVP